MYLSGSYPLVVELLPNAKHKMCAWNIYSNWDKKYKGKQLMRHFRNVLRVPTWQILRCIEEAEGNVSTTS